MLTNHDMDSTSPFACLLVGQLLAVIVVGGDTSDWHVMDHDGTSLTHSAYYLPLFGMPPTSNEATGRLELPMSNLLTAVAMRALMDAEAARWAS